MLDPHRFDLFRQALVTPLPAQHKRGPSRSDGHADPRMDPTPAEPAPDPADPAPLGIGDLYEAATGTAPSGTADELTIADAPSAEARRSRRDLGDHSMGPRRSLRLILAIRAYDLG